MIRDITMSSWWSQKPSQCEVVIKLNVFWGIKMLYTVLMNIVASKHSLRFPRRMNISAVDLSLGKHNEQLREFILPWGPVLA